MFQFEGGDVGPAHNLVRRVHVARCAMGLGIADLLEPLLVWGVRSWYSMGGGDDVGLGGDVWRLIRERDGHETLGYWGRLLIWGHILGIMHHVTHFYLEEVLGRSIDLLE